MLLANTTLFMYWSAGYISAMAFVHHIAQTGFGTGTNELYDRSEFTSIQAPGSYLVPDP